MSDNEYRLSRGLVLSIGVFLWFVAVVVGWQNGCGLGGAVAGSLFVLCQAPLWFNMNAI